MAGIRVLCVDDSVVVRKIVTDALNADPNIEVVGTAPNGKLALTKWKQLQPDAITMDIEMPEMNGIEAVRELRRMGCKDRIMRRAARGKGLSARAQQRNAGISRARCRVERTFGAMRRWFHGGTARYVGLAKTHAQHVMEAIAHNLYRAPGLIVANA